MSMQLAVVMNDVFLPSSGELPNFYLRPDLAFLMALGNLKEPQAGLIGGRNPRKANGYEIRNRMTPPLKTINAPS